MIKCPKCEIVMNEVLKADINIDVCPKCMGVWLDKGELDKIIERSQSYTASNNNYYEEDRDDYKHHDDEHNNGDYKGKVQYDKNGRPMKRRGGIGEILGNLFD